MSFLPAKKTIIVPFVCLFSPYHVLVRDKLMWEWNNDKDMDQYLYDNVSDVLFMRAKIFLYMNNALSYS